MIELQVPVGGEVTVTVISNGSLVVEGEGKLIREGEGKDTPQTSMEVQATVETEVGARN